MGNAHTRETLLIMASYTESRVSFHCLHEVTSEAVVRRVDYERLVVEKGVVGVEDIAGHSLAEWREIHVNITWFILTVVGLCTVTLTCGSLTSG